MLTKLFFCDNLSSGDYMKTRNSVYLSDLKDYLKEKLGTIESLEFTNIVDYIKSSYGISAVDLAKLFGVKRGTIYNYIYGKHDIPMKVINIILSVYGVSTYNELVLLERIPNYYKAKAELIEKKIIDNKITDMDRIYLKSFDSGSQISFDVRDEVNYREKWLAAISTMQKQPNPSEDEPYVSKMIQYMSKNDSKYNITLVELISQARINDENLLIGIDKYLNDERKLGNLGTLTTEPQVIQHKIDEVVKRKQSVVSVDYEDFTELPKTHIQFKVKSIENQSIILQDIEHRVNSIVLVISSRADIRLSVIDKIINQLRDAYGHNIKFVIGTSILDQSNEDTIDIFFM